MISRLEYLETRHQEDQAYEILCIFGDNGDLGTVRIRIDGEHSELLEITDGVYEDEEDDDQF